MIVTCERCATQFRLDDTKVPPQGVRVRCSRCKHAFFVEPSGGAEGERVHRVAEEAVAGKPRSTPDATQDLCVPAERGAGAAEPALDAEDGAKKWSRRGFGKGALMMADGKLIVLSERGIHLAIVEATPSGFREISRAKVLDGHTWTPPVLANGRIYCRNDAGDVACVDVRGK